MDSKDAAIILGRMTSGFHRETMEAETVDLWLEILEPYDFEIAWRVADGWVKNQDKFPTISQFRHAYHVERRQGDPHELSAAHETPADLGLSESGCPQWVQRWLRRFKVVSEIENPRERARFKDWRVFPEQIVGESKYTDDPRYTTSEAAELGLMPEDAWLETA